MVDLYHFYHIYCGPNFIGQKDTWKESVGIHIDSIKNYGLIDKLKTIHIGLVGPEIDRNEVKIFLNEKGINYTIIDEKDHGWEQLTQNKMYEFSQLNNGYVLYGHSKGSYNFNNQNRDWCKSMIYFNIVKWEDAVEKLNTNDAVGCYWFDFTGQVGPGGPHTGQRWFAGTFWWSKLELIKTINPPTMFSRWDAEVWIGKIPNIKIYDITNSGGPHPGNIVTTW